MKIIDEPSIIESTFVKISHGSKPVRIVLREIKPVRGSGLKTEYSVHYETMSISCNELGASLIHESFYDGSFFFNKDKAMNCYLDKANKW